ncbi:PP2C family protein-serine/threonine phosphatase [Symbioplanes lichenis]|uniref:PP2C family protein-serine/threonine phosphatase n=1 Tax=Symbioplanes lichenis TaxID=1629072 RepID=UPI002738C389|nr:PP2C family protein-serine/threonine phosphatase [Actinoplanes lichenis]
MTEPFAAAGSLLDAYRRVDWAATAVGEPHTWSPALRGALDLVLGTRTPSTLLWGPEQVLLYNEAYAPILGDKHPAALGRPCAAVFPEIWDTIGPMLEAVYRTGGSMFFEDLRLLLERRGFAEETFFTFSYSPVRGVDGTVEGVIDIVWETTTPVVAHRRLALLGRLNDSLAGVADVAGLLEHALPVLCSDDLTAVGIRPAPPGVPGRDVVLERTPEGTEARVRLAGADAVLVGRLSPHLPVDEAYLGFVRLIGTALAQGLTRARALEAERHAATLQRELAEALQRSLLEPPAQPDHLEVAVRYRPAAEGAEIGGDWYDSFLLPDGRLAVVIGDVTGHDRRAAAAMSQIRNLLRGISYTVVRPPSEILTALDEAMAGFGVRQFATAVVADIDVTTEGSHLVRWSNAGHLAPALVAPDGSARLLLTKGETLLGTGTAVARTDHSVQLDPGAALVLYTDGLIERRTGSLDDGYRDLLAHLDGRSDRTAEQLCDHILEHFAVGTEDDVALAVVRLRPE